MLLSNLVVSSESRFLFNDLLIKAKDKRIINGIYPKGITTAFLYVVAAIMLINARIMPFGIDNVILKLIILISLLHIETIIDIIEKIEKIIPMAEINLMIE